jgi:DNA-binding XRE family transcriptional regulator/tetratricopeptide (TPR) repeat protein
VVRESDAIESARRALGAQLAEYRRAAGYSQTEFGVLVGYSRSSVANVETGRQHVPSHFWVTADEVVHAEGALVALSGETDAAARREREEAAQATRLYFVGLARDGSAVPGGHLAPVPGDAGDAPGHMAGWLDAIAMAAGQAREHAEGAAVTDVGPGTVEQFRADVVRLGRAYVSAPPLPLFAAMHQALGRVQAALRSRTYPGQARDLNFLAGALGGLMANASLDLGREEAADDLARAAWTHGRIIDNGPLMGWARGTQALAAIWDHRYLDAIRHVQDGLAQLPAGAGTVRLHAIHARALAAYGERGQAAAAIEAAGKARADAPWDDLHDGVGGEFTFDDAKLWYYQALTLADADDPVRAEHAAAVAIRLYQGVPARARSYGCEALARVQLARARLMRRKLDDAADALGGMLSLDPQLRIGSLSEYLETCRELLRTPAYRGSRTARQLDQQLAAFSGASAVRALPGGR